MHIILIFIVTVLALIVYFKTTKQLIVIRGVDSDDARIKDIISKTSNPVRIIIDTTNTAVNNREYISHSEESCKAINPLHRDIRYSLDSVIWHIYEHVKNYDFDYLWILEDDVYCDGSLDGIINKNTSKTEDFLASFVENYGDNPNEINWMHWDSLHSQSDNIPSKENRVKSFFPVTRYSKRFLREIYDSIGLYSGYCEVYIPTLAKQKGYTYGNLEKTSIGNLSTNIIDPMPNNKDDRLYHKWKKYTTT